MTPGRLLRLPANVPLLLQWAVVFFLVHLVCAAWVASSEAGAWIAVVLTAAAVWLRQLRASFHILFFPLFAYALISSISALTSDRRLHAAGESALWMKFLLFPAALILMREIPRVRDLALRAVLGFGAMAASIGLVQYAFQGQRDLEHRINGLAAHVMTFSGLLLPVALLFLVLAIHRRTPLLIAGALATNLTLLLTFTRSVWIGWFVGMGVLLMAKRPRWVIWAVPLLILFVALMPMALFSRLASTFDTRQSSNFDRIRMAQGGVEMVKDYPLLGVGPGNVKEVYPLYRLHDAPRFRIPHLHDNLVQIPAERGVVALAAYLLLIGLFLRECVRGWNGEGREMAEAGVAMIVALSVAGLFEFNFGDTEVVLLLMSLMALVVTSVEPPLADAGFPEWGAVNERAGTAVPAPGTVPSFQNPAAGRGPSPVEA